MALKTGIAKGGWRTAPHLEAPLCRSTVLKAPHRLSPSSKKQRLNSTHEPPRPLTDSRSLVPVLQESENLEKENAALRKEVKQLTEEAKYLSSVLSSHEPLCTGLSAQTPELLFPPHHSSYHNQHIPVPHYQH